MALNRIPCPECGAGLKSPSGFKVGQNVCCPKCETYFTVEEPPEEDEVEENEIPKKKQASSSSSKSKTAGKKPLRAAGVRDDDDEDDDEDEDQPKKKKKKRRDDSERSYQSSPLRFAILGVLVVVMLVLGYFYYDKIKKQRAADDDFIKVIEPKISSSEKQLQPVQPKGPGGQKAKQGGPVNVPANPAVPFPNQPKQNGPPGLGGLLGSTPLTEAEKKQLLEKYKARLTGTWKADLGGGVTVQLVYGADGKASATITTPDKTETFSSVWTPTGEVSRKGLTVAAFAGTKFTGDIKPMDLIFEDDELQHPVFDPVLKQTVIGIFRKA
jgi:hypothetical protein